MNLKNITLKNIEEAQRVLARYLEPTPLVLNPWLSDEFGCEVYLKLETMQPVGSFKIRGATFKIAGLSATKQRKGVIAASAGNHAQGVAWGARELGVKALIVMPKSASLIKIQNTKLLGAEIHLEGDSFDEACVAAERLARKTGRTLVHAFEDPAIVAGQGTAGLEILEQLPSPDFVVGAVGGGGLMAGVSIVMQALSPHTKTVGAQAENASSMIRSLRTGKIQRLPAQTFADGVAMSQASPTMRSILNKNLSHALTVTEDEIAQALLTLLEKAKIVVEGSGAIPLAALDRIRKRIRRKRVVLLLSGGNIDLTLLSRIIEMGLIRAGRRLRMNVGISDRVGSLHRLTGVLSSIGANVIQAIHDRSEPFIKMDETEVELTLETRGPDHSEQVIRTLTEHCLRVSVFDSA